MTCIIPVDHRPWSVPNHSWVMRQIWHDLLFMHWPMDPAVLRRLVPASLPLDSYDGQAWIGVVPFRMSGIRLRGTPAIPWLSAFPELNVRTYVTLNGKPGVYFFSLDAGNPIAVHIARLWFHLPYYWAHMALEKTGERIRYRSHRRVSHPSAALEGTYYPIGPVDMARPGSLAYWFTERYCLYTADSKGSLFCGEIAHAPWPLQPAVANFTLNSMADPLGIKLPSSAPLLHFSARQDVFVWNLERVKPPPVEG